MYDIGFPEIIITDRLEDDKNISIKYIAEAAKKPFCTAPNCTHKLSPHRHDVTHYLLRDVKSEGKCVYIELHIRRYKCPECGSVFPDTFTFFTKKQHLTHRLKDEFVNRCIKGESFLYIANDYGIDSKTVAAAFQEYVNRHKEKLDYSYTPEVLGIDEAHIDDHYRLVLTDIKGQKLLDMKRDNEPRTIKKYLKSLDKSICKYVTMDFAPVYAAAVSEILPDALIVIDRFHVVQEINRCLDNLRKRVQKEHLDMGESIRKYKHSRNLFMTNWEDLSDRGEASLSRWFNEIPEFYEGYMCKEMFRDIFNVAESWEDAESLFDAWLSSVPAFPEFETMKKTMTKRREHILNYWECRYTNAYTESVNNAIKTIEKRGRGYKFDRLRELCILEVNRPKPEKFDPRTAVYTSVTRKRNTERSALYAKGIDFIAKIKSKDLQQIKELPIRILFEAYSLSNQKESFEERMKAYYNALASRSLLS